MKNKVIVLNSSLLSLVFFWTTGVKLWGYIQLETGFDSFPFVENYRSILFWGLTVSQLGIAVFLWPHKTRLLAFYAAFFVLASLSTYLYVMLHYVDHIPCACIGILPGLSWKGHLLFTIGFTVLAGINIVLLPDKDIHAHG